MTRYQEILDKQKGIKHSKTTKPALEFISFMKSRPAGTKHRGANYISEIRNGFLVRHTKWDNLLYDVTNSEGVLMYIQKRYLSDVPVEPKCGTIDKNAVYDDVIKVHLRELKF